LLIVDDIPHIRAAFEAEARCSGLFSVVTSAESGPLALKALRLMADEGADRLPNVIIIDLFMPNMNGLMLLCELRRIPALGAMRRIIVSGWDGPEELNASHLAGCHAFFKKPPHGESLASLMQAVAGPMAQPNVRTEVRVVA
jgi:CheY-like chemotaxis protein